MQRRSNGDGSVFQVSENKWVAKIYLGKSVDGKPQIKQFSGKTEAIVKKKLREFKKSNEFMENYVATTYTFVLILHCNPSVIIAVFTNREREPAVKSTGKTCRNITENGENLHYFG